MTKITKPTSHLVFVYGTLQSGQVNNGVLTDEGSATLLGKATTMQKFYMADGGFPRVGKRTGTRFPAGINPSRYWGQIAGELWRADDDSFAACDRLEGHPRFYKREEVPVTLNQGKVRHKAWIYLIVDPVMPGNCLEKDLTGLLQWQGMRWPRAAQEA